MYAFCHLQKKKIMKGKKNRKYLFSIMAKKQRMENIITIVSFSATEE
jgi:hypothetical protein